MDTLCLRDTHYYCELNHSDLLFMQFKGGCESNAVHYKTAPPPCFRIHAFISISPARTYIRCKVHLIARPIRAPRVNQLRWRMLKLPYTLTAHRLQTGWSSLQPSGSLDSHEQAAIIAVIKRNEQLETAEQQRVGRLVERLENNKLRAAECGPRFCRCVFVLRCNVRTKQARA